MKRKIFKSLLAIVCLLGSINASAYDIKVENEDGVIICYNYINNRTELAVTYHGYYYYYSNEYVGNVVIPESVTYNGKTYIVTSIDSNAFYDCRDLTSVTIPNSVTSIGSNAFYRCSGLKKVIVKDLAAWCGISFSDSSSNPLGYAHHLYSDEDAEITNLVIPNSVTSIGSNAFWGCSGLTSVTISNSVTFIGDNAFMYCSNLNSITIGAGVLSIGSNVYGNHKPAKVIWLTNTPPSGYTNAWGYVNYVANEQYSFSNKTVYPFLSSMFEVDGVKYVPVSPSERTCDAIDCAYNESAENIHIGSTVTNQGISLTVKQIHPYALYGNASIKNVELGFGGDIGDYAFYGCTALESVELTNNGNIGEYVFASSNIASTLKVNNAGSVGKSAFADIAGSFTANINCAGEIMTSAFENSIGLVTLSIGNNVTNIGNDVFSGCTNLKNAQISNHGTIGANAFQNCTSMETATLGEQITSLGSNVFRGCSKLQSIVIPDAVNTMGSYAFEGCKSLTSAKIGTGIQSIGAYTFAGCSALTEILIPQSVTNINNYVFSGCSSLANITFEDAEVQDENPMATRFPDWTSTNHSNNSESHQEYTFSVVPGDYLQFNYAVDSESGYDRLIVKINGNTVVDESGNKTGNYRRDFTEAGNVTLYLSYTKDRSDSYGADQASVTDIWLNGGSSNLILTMGSNGSSPLFADCPLDSVYIGRNISYNTSSSYGYSPFYRNTSLRAFVITDVETEIPANEFYGCTNLKNVKIGNSVTSIGDWAFSGCSSLEAFEFGSAVETIGKEAFSDCTAMTKLISHAATPPTCGTQALDDINKWMCTLSVPTGYATAYQQADQWKEFFFINDDVDITGVKNIISDSTENVAVYTLGGIKRTMKKEDLKSLPKGIYIINNKKVVVK